MILDPEKSLWWHFQRSLDETAAFTSNTHTAPIAVLWPDPERLWEPTVALLRQRLPHLITLGEYQPELRQGPAIYLRCLIGRQLTAAAWPASVVPLVYLPGWGMANLQAVESCPEALAPLVELAYRGTTWRQVNGRDWTPVAWCCNKQHGLNLSVAEDRATGQALRGNLPQLIDRPLREFQGKRLDAAAVHHLVVPDLVRELLCWLNDADTVKETGTNEARWTAFRASMQREYGCDPVSDGQLTAAELLAKRQGPWALVWDRFAEHPQNYPRLPALLRKATMGLGILLDSQTLPGFNDTAEENLRLALSKLTETHRTEAGKRILALDQEHEPRRHWVWATLGEAPLARALEPLARLAQGCQLDLGGASANELAAAYRDGAWRLDAAARQAITLVDRADDRAAVTAALRAVYAPWLDAGATALQALITTQGSPASGQVQPDMGPGEVWLFVDGLRYDLGMELADRLQGRGLRVELGSQWAALPTVTATAKPAASPVADQLTGTPPGTGFQPIVIANAKELTTDRFASLLKQAQIAVLPESSCGDPTGMAWTEIGQVDSLGHSNQANLPRFIPEQLQRIAERLVELLAAGWRRVRVITDHGWLWLPISLPKRNLPKHCTIAQSHWSRCAVLDDGVQVDVPVIHWHWNSQVAIAMAPGSGTFVDGTAYSHGGISIQECLIPVITVEQEAPVSTAAITDVAWVGLRCKVTVTGATGGERVDLRGKAGDPASTRLAAGVGGTPQPAAVASDGTASLYADDAHEGSPAILVLLDAKGIVIDKHACEIGV